MAKPTTFPEQNFTFTLGIPGNNPENDLPCYRDEIGIVSCWELTEDEIAILTNTKKIYVCILGQQQPRMSVCADIPAMCVDEFPEIIEDKS